MKAASEQPAGQQNTTTEYHAPTPLLISAEDLAALLQISTRSLRRLLNAGKLPQPVRLGRSVRWRRQEVEDWINRGCPGD